MGSRQTGGYCAALTSFKGQEDSWPGQATACVVSGPSSPTTSPRKPPLHTALQTKPSGYWHLVLPSLHSQAHVDEDKFVLL